MGKNLPAVWEIWVSSLSWEDPPEEGMATHSSIPAWRIPWTEKPGELSFMGCKELDTTEATKHRTHIFLLRELLKDTSQEEDS